MKREFSAGGVVYKKVKGDASRDKILWLVTKSKPSKEYPKDVWRLPKGWLDDSDGGKKPGQLASGIKRASGERIVKVAVKEVAEEGGVGVKVVKRIITDKYFYTNKENEKVMKFVNYFLMEWREDLEEGFGEETEKVEWLIFDKANERLSYARERKVLENAKRIIDNMLS